MVCEWSFFCQLMNFLIRTCRLVCGYGCFMPSVFRLLTTTSLQSCVLLVFCTQRHGKGVETLKSGTVFEGNWEGNRKHGKGFVKLKLGVVEQQVCK